MDLKHITNESDKDYHSTDALTASKLKKFFKSPLLYQMDRNGMLPQVASSSMRLGTLVHIATLEPQRLMASVDCDAPVNPKTGNPYGVETKAAKEWHDNAVAAGMLPCTNEELSMAMSMAASVHQLCMDQGIGLGSDGSMPRGMYAESTLRGTMPHIGLVQCRPDLWDTQNQVIYDLKTCDDIDQFRSSFYTYRHDIQACWYRHLAENYTGQTQSWRFLVVERNALCRSCIFIADEPIQKLLWPEFGQK